MAVQGWYWWTLIVYQDHQQAPTNWDINGLMFFPAQQGFPIHQARLFIVPGMMTWLRTTTYIFWVVETEPNVSHGSNYISWWGQWLVEVHHLHLTLLAEWWFNLILQPSNLSTLQAAIRQWNKALSGCTCNTNVTSQPTEVLLKTTSTIKLSLRHCLLFVRRFAFRRVNFPCAFATMLGRKKIANVSLRQCLWPLR